MRTQIGEKKDRSLVARVEAALSQMGGGATRKRKASAEERTLVRDAMSSRVASISAEAPIADAAERLAEQDVGVLAICQAGDRLSGVITDRDIVVRVIAQGLDPDELTVGECGSGEPATASPQETLDQAAQRMDEQQVRRLPVTHAGRLIGILSHSDLAAHGADRRASRLLERLARQGGDRRSARWLLDRPYGEGRSTAASAPRLRGGS
ncbi:MAG TPA: CBS domain-containing protein [Solirubrobacterales bacterium]|nr:CBS domain-containing protein [Solirubrobacterales bacterium]